MSNTTKKRASVSFAAVDQYVESNIISPTEKKSGKDFVEWGDGNAYPDYLLELYNSVSTLRSIINGNVDFITGDDVTIEALRDGLAPNAVNTRGDLISEQVKDIAKDYEMYGGFALQVIRGRDGKVSEIYHIDMRFLRMNKECNVFYYCEDWNKGGKKNAIKYPLYMPGIEKEWMSLTDEQTALHASSIVFVKNVRTQTYPAPLYAASIKACEIERCVDDYHLNAINNGFVSSAIINFNNGTPSDEIMEEIEDNFNEKFSGHANAGRICFSWNKDKEHATTIDSVSVEDFGERYQSLAKHSRQQIFTAFRANPNLFGIPTESLGFSSEEYESAFRLYNRTQIRPVQRMIADTYDKIFGKRGVLTITPFSIDEGTTTDTIVK